MKNIEKKVCCEAPAVLRLLVFTVAAAAVRYAVCVPQVMNAFGK